LRIELTSLERPATAENQFETRDKLLALAGGEGFEFAAIAPVALPPNVRETALRELGEGKYAGMGWMTEAWTVRASSAETFLPGCRSILMLGLHTAPPAPLPATDGITRGRVARYAWGRDYHRVFEARMRKVVREIREKLGGEARATVDYGPLLERPFAVLGGLGWLGKSTMLLIPGVGPWVLLGAIATDLLAEPGGPLRKSCGSCNRCVRACPTGALGEAGNVLDARLCVSYQTIENRGPIPRQLRPRMGSWVFGCDDCLISCPVGSRSLESEADLEERAPSLSRLLELDEAAFKERFRGRAVARARRDGLARNACVALGNTGDEEDLADLFDALRDGAPLVRGHAAWAIALLTLRSGAARGPSLGALKRQRLEETDAWVHSELDAAMVEVGAG